MSKIPATMQPFYAQLNSHGLSHRFVQDAILPDWWDDSLFENGINRLTAQMSAAKFLGVGIEHFTDFSADVALPIQNVQLKRNRNTQFSEVTGAIMTALHAARITAGLMRDTLAFTGTHTAQEVRNSILSESSRPWPDLPGLIDYCWKNGIAVVHITRLPKPSKAIAGLATFIDDRPVIVLCSGRDSPAWLAFHLAHELGHIMSGHVKPGDDPVVDIKLDTSCDEDIETQADEYALQVLTGIHYPDMDISQNLGAKTLADTAHALGALYQIHPGTVALIYGYRTRRLPVAQKALQIMGENFGATRMLSNAYSCHVPLDDMADSAQQFLSATTQVFEPTLFSAAY
ncbi:ImmA/IrrE family metallo-endopeptidase [Sinimarinibacterium sp. NLF-5-8]|uniref:ImmA/IrrE family metallo-endopeptidase n=1 Tax=Sinimarinibacterium sp. NLF-5-8 TaxID=2698684 RepID=UPI00137BD407|nr:ImmA/IrrE family metallo-endopeptidase [Sinimarinibacterium sp. NLF-5-8]QHS09107.1 hypothetical protein GT972_02365 [Sinimarinibacterium sp. NLF-5-8]